MPAIVTTYLPQIEALCRENGIRRLDLFGSGATGAFDAGHSDLDFLVDLGEYDRTVGRRYLRLVSSLVRIFGRDIDVVTIRGVTKNPEFLAEIQRTRRTLYEA